MKALYEQFKKEKLYLENLSPRTIKYYEWTFNCWDKHGGQMPTQTNLKEWVIQLVASGISPATINSRIRGLNSFLTWLFENNHIGEPVRIKTIKEGQKTLKTFSEAQLKKLLAWKPKKFADQRLYTLICLLIDTGLRIDEALTLQRGGVDFENLLVTVRGKGNKERIVPISIECRKHLFKLLKLHSFDYVFPARHGSLQNGTQLSYRTALDQLKVKCRELGISGVRTSYHNFRHTFASSYVRDGGNVLYLQKVLGHSDLQTTKVYVNAQTQDLALMHRKTSLLTRLK